MNFYLQNNVSSNTYYYKRGQFNDEERTETNFPNNFSYSVLTKNHTTTLKHRN